MDALDLGRAAFGDLEHEVHAVLLELDDLRLDLRRIAALATIDVEQALHVGLDAGAGEDRARLQLHLVAQRLGVDLAVTLEGDLVDHRVLDHGHDDVGPGALDAHVGEEAGGEQRFDRPVDLGGIEGTAHRELQVGPDRLRLDALIALNVDGPDRSALGLRRNGVQCAADASDPR